MTAFPLPLHSFHLRLLLQIFCRPDLVKEKQRFINVLFKKYSVMAQEKVFSDTFSTTALAVCKEFESAKALNSMDFQELTDFIMEKGKNRFPDTDAVTKAIHKAAGNNNSNFTHNTSFQNYHYCNRKCFNTKQTKKHHIAGINYVKNIKAVLPSQRKDCSY